MLFALNTMGNADMLKNEITKICIYIIVPLQILFYYLSKKITNKIFMIGLIVINILLPYFIYFM
jgi:hypothetical protein